MSKEETHRPGAERLRLQGGSVCLPSAMMDWAGQRDSHTTRGRETQALRRKQVTAQHQDTLRMAETENGTLDHSPLVCHVMAWLREKCPPIPAVGGEPDSTAHHHAALWRMGLVSQLASTVELTLEIVIQSWRCEKGIVSFPSLVWRVNVGVREKCTLYYSYRLQLMTELTCSFTPVPTLRKAGRAPVCAAPWSWPCSQGVLRMWEWEKRWCGQGRDAPPICSRC